MRSRRARRSMTVFPAGAGMNRAECLLGLRAVVFPAGAGMNRARAAHLPNADVFPAGAGMNRLLIG